MQITVSELKANVGKYVGLAELQDVFITKHGKRVAKLVSTKIDRAAAMQSVFGAIPPDADLDKAKAERLL